MRFRFERRHLWKRRDHTQAIDLVVQVRIIQIYRFVNWFGHFSPWYFFANPWGLFLFLNAIGVITLIDIVLYRDVSRNVKLVLFVQVLFEFVAGGLLNWFTFLTFMALVLFNIIRVVLRNIRILILSPLVPTKCQN